MFFIPCISRDREKETDRRKGKDKTRHKDGNIFDIHYLATQNMTCLDLEELEMEVGKVSILTITLQE